MRLEYKTLVEWGVADCVRGEIVLPWFEKNFPKGVEDSPSGLLKRMPEDWIIDKLWLLEQIAIRDPGKDGEEAIDLLMDMAEPYRLAQIVVGVKDHDTTRVYNKVMESEDKLGYYTLISNAELSVALDVARAIDDNIKEEYIKRLPKDRKNIFELSRDTFERAEDGDSTINRS